MASTSLVRLRNIVKRYGDFTANDGIDLDVAAGSVHAVVGENGAGKSTLMKVLAGEERPDEGRVEIDGVAQRFASPRDAQRAGIGIVHQHFLLAGALRVWENVVLADEPGSGGRLDGRTARARVSQLARDNGFDLNVDAVVDDLGVGDRQRVEILKVLYRRARVIILDEPTAVLVPHEVEVLFTAVRRLVEAGAAVLFISHHLDEVLAHSDDISVIRAGRLVGRAVPASTTARELAGLMVEVEMPTVAPRQVPVGETIALRAHNLTVSTPGERPALDALSFDVHAGEVVGIAGVEGNGQSELLLALLGRLPSTGSVEVGGRDVSHLSTQARRGLGIGYVPEDRHHDGLLLSSSLADNAALGYHDRPPLRRGWRLDHRAAARKAAHIIAEFGVRGGGARTVAAALSGGNQQKFILGRELDAGPRVLLASQPTRGVDIGAQAALWEQLATARDAGLATLVVSADLGELLALSDRLLVMFAGRIVAELDPRHVTAEQLGEYMTGSLIEANDLSGDLSGDPGRRVGTDPTPRSDD